MSLNRYTFFPIQDQVSFDFYKKAVANFWTAEEIDLSDDVTQWQTKLNDDEKNFIKQILAFFASSDGIVSENLVLNFYQEFEVAEVRAFYATQMFIEQIHSEVYSLFIEHLVDDVNEKNNLFNAIEEHEFVARKAQWALKWMDNKNTKSERVLAFAIVEGLFFSASFCALFWLRKKGIMTGLCFSNELISRDEGLHTEFAIHMYKKYCEPLSNDVIHKIVSEAVECEIEFVKNALRVDLVGMNSSHMVMYVQFVADFLLSRFGVPTLYNVENPFPFMNQIGLVGKTNFFERKVSDYKNSKIVNGSSNVQKLDFDF